MSTTKPKDRTARPLRRATKHATKAVPAFKTEAEERAFWETHDSTDYVDWGHASALQLRDLKPSPQ
jgi:CopG antitoxin of type II toxin-antitoxin system